MRWFLVMLALGSFSLAQNLRPPNTPDVFILGISGKCLKNASGQSCSEPKKANMWQIFNTELPKSAVKSNYNYLEPRGTLGAIASTLQQKGYSVALKGYASSWQDVSNENSGTLQTHSGIAALFKDLDFIEQNYITGYSNPSKIILVAHSHGVVWSHIVSMVRPKTPIEVQLDFDGVCLNWDSDQMASVLAAGDSYKLAWRKLCASPSILGGASYENHNVVYSNVKYNIEVQASKTRFDDLIGTLLFDGFNNYRLDGSTEGIFTYRSEQENHSGITAAGSMGLSFVQYTLNTLF